jgi:hypothetical protein
MKTSHKVNTMEKEIIVFTKGKQPFIHKLGYHTKCYINECYINGYMPFVQEVKMEPAYKKQNGHENLVLTPWVTSEVTSYQAICLPNLSSLKISLPAS